jgi:hypothetical protein
MTSSGAKEYPWCGKGRNMALGLDKFLAPTRGYPTVPIADEADQELSIAVVYTSVHSTLAALKEAGDLASQLGARITLIVPEVVPYAVPIETPPIAVLFNENRFRVIASRSLVETNVQICLCRDRLAALRAALKPGSIVIVGGRKRWWPTKDERLARDLRCSGYEVIFKETE